MRATLRDAEGRQRGMILHTMGGMQDQIQTLEKSLREETRRVEDANTKLAQREQEIESLKQVLMDEILEASHASAAAKKDRDLVARLSRADEMLQMHSRGMKVANETAAQAEEMVIRFQCAISEFGSMLALAKDREQREATAAAAARTDLIALQQRLAVETASHAAERKGLEAKLVMTKDVRHNLEAKLAAKEEENAVARKEIAELLSNMQQLEALIPLVKCELKFQKWRSSASTLDEDAPV